jgi:hypothetical protein
MIRVLRRVEGRELVAEGQRVTVLLDYGTTMKGAALPGVNCRGI